ncbi:MAG: CcmD family protein [Ignavibacteriales bacterium]|nr:CcmD family protein [Ignavibacteriales bacterium]
MEGLIKYLENHSILIVLIVVLIVWTGIFFFINKIDKRLKKIEEKFKDIQE